MYPINSPQIVFLSGPSSSGKTISTQNLEERGWIRLEADAERPSVEIKLLKTTLLDKLAYLESHFTNPTPATLIGAICGGTKPVKIPFDPNKYEKVRLELLDCIDTRNREVSQLVLIHMLDKALSLYALGKSVILDHVPFINDPGFTSSKVTRDKTYGDLWHYRHVKIEQQLKYVPVEILMRNVIRRNEGSDSENHRDMLMVLEQYAERFKVSESSNDLQLGKLSTANLRKWVERGVKISFFVINPNHKFIYDPKKDGDIDSVIQRRLEQFKEEMDDPENAIDPAGEKVDAINIQRLKEKKLEFPHLQKKIDDTTKKIMEMMKMPNAPTEVSLTYTSSSGIKPTIITD